MSNCDAVSYILCSCIQQVCAKYLYGKMYSKGTVILSLVKVKFRAGVGDECSGTGDRRVHDKGHLECFLQDGSLFAGNKEEAVTQI